MSELRTRKFWEKILQANPDFVGFGNPNAETCIISDTFIIPPQSDELEISFKLERVSAVWNTLLVSGDVDSMGVNFCPSFAETFIETLSRFPDRSDLDQTYFFLALSSHFYFESESTWKFKLTEKLASQRSLIQSFSKIVLVSRFISRADFEEIFPKGTFKNLHIATLQVQGLLKK
jgi:hypothetical protein